MWWHTFVFRRKGRVHLNRRGRQFSRLLAAEVCASASVMLDTPCSEVVRRVLAAHSIRPFPLQFPFRASPCAITFQTQSICKVGAETVLWHPRYSNESPVLWTVTKERWNGVETTQCRLELPAAEPAGICHCRSLATYSFLDVLYDVKIVLCGDDVVVSVCDLVSATKPFVGFYGIQANVSWKSAK